MVNAKLPVDISKFKKLSFDAKNNKLSAEQKADLQHNIDIFRDAIVAFTTTGAARGVAGHTGGPFDTAVSLRPGPLYCRRTVTFCTSHQL